VALNVVRGGCRRRRGPMERRTASGAHEQRRQGSRRDGVDGGGRAGGPIVPDLPSHRPTRPAQASFAVQQNFAVKAMKSCRPNRSYTSLVLAECAAPCAALTGRWLIP
jgi:hypothetical protein